MALGKRRRWLATAGLGVSVALAATGCLQDPNASTGGGVGGVGGTVDNNQDDGDGVVTILGAYGGDEKENFEKALAPFEEESGIDIQYTEDTDFTTTIKTRVAAGDTPDIGFFPQPGGLLELADQGKIQPIDTFLDYDAIDKTLVPGLLDSARLNGRVYGAPMRLAHKSIVWYPKKAWDAAGYKAPATLDDLFALTEQIKADGIETPWCMAWNADQATGWVGTDWIEQFVLSVNGPNVYNQWTSHEIPFDDPQIVQAFDEFAKIAKSDTVYGGAKTVVQTQVAEAMVPAFRNPPECMLERQGSFEISFLPVPIQENLDEEVGVFPFPAAEATGEAPPILGGADLAALFNGNDEEAIDVMRFLTSDKFGVEWAQAGGWLSPHRTFDASNYPNQTTKDIAEQAAAAPVVVFDGSDVMPKEVGSGTFWTGMVDWIQGQDSKATASAIEGSWPQ
jgi:alpha-glucoside transport system substrate-binding protein